MEIHYVRQVLILTIKAPLFEGLFIFLALLRIYLKIKTIKGTEIFYTNFEQDEKLADNSKMAIGLLHS